MAVWVVMPSKRPPAEAEKCLSCWREMGYKTAIQRDVDHETPPPGWMRGSGGYPDWNDTYVEFRPYAGYAEAVNFLAKAILAYDPSCNWIVAAGDDMMPDPNKRADEIAQECSEYFEKKYDGIGSVDERQLRYERTFGVMQPTGDRDWGDRRGPYCDFVAGSPWMGREWCKRINQGKGPLWPDYFHMGCDEELQAVAIKYGVFWQRPDLIHKHLNWGRPTDGRKMVDVSEMPDFLVKANSPAEWNKYKRIFKERSEAGFPGSEPTL